MNAKNEEPNIEGVILALNSKVGKLHDKDWKYIEEWDKNDKGDTEGISGVFEKLGLHFFGPENYRPVCYLLLGIRNNETLETKK